MTILSNVNHNHNNLTYTVTAVSGGGGGSGQITNSITNSYAFNNSGQHPLLTIPYNSNEVIVDEKATLEVKGTVRINGQDLEERLKTIEKVLMIPERDAELEKEFPKLKKMYDDYINQLEKYRTWKRIKDGS